MKKTLLFVLALIASGCADPIPRNLDDLVQQGEVYLDRETMRPHSGPVFRFFPNDTTRVWMSANLKDGKMDGPYEFYYENGQLSSKGSYVAGERDGPYEFYYENGQLADKATYVDGAFDGPFESYYDNGQLREKSTFAAGERDGPYESYLYWSNGQLREKSTFAAGERDGPFERYRENGQLAVKSTFVAGEWHGPYETYPEDGLNWKGTYNMGERCGEWIVAGGTVTNDPCPPGLADGN